MIYTDLVNACLDHFMSSDMFFSNSPLLIPKSAAGLLNHSSENTALNVVHFLSKVIDSVWNCLFRGNPIRILKCYLKLLSEAHASNKAISQLNCNESHLNSLFRVILYILSRPIENVDSKSTKSLSNVPKLFSSNVCTRFPVSIGSKPALVFVKE